MKKSDLSFDERNLIITPYENSRKIVGNSGPLRLATNRKNGQRWIVKNAYLRDVANEFVCCNLGVLLGLDVPHACIGTIDKSPAVAIEFIDGFSRFDIKELTPPLINQFVEQLAFNAFIDNADNVQWSAVVDDSGSIIRIVSYDLADTFGWEHYNFNYMLHTDEDGRIRVARNMIDSYMRRQILSVESICNVAVKITSQSRENINVVINNFVRKICALNDEILSPVWLTLDDFFPGEVSVCYSECLNQLRTKLSTSISAS